MMSIPERLSRSATITVNAPPDRAFPLFGVAEQTQWVEGWKPRLVFPGSNTITEKMVFITPIAPGGEDYIWIVSRYAPHELCLEYTATASDRVGFMSIRCSRTADHGTETEITCTFIGLSERGCLLNAETLDRLYIHGLRDREEAMNHYLATGEKLSTSRAL